MTPAARAAPVRPPATALGSVAALLLAIAVGVHLRDSAQLDIKTPLPGNASPTWEDPSLLATEVAVELNAIDYRQRASWLETLRPLTTERAYGSLETVFGPLVWSAFEASERVVPKDQISAVDLGLIVGGPDWEVRLVEVQMGRSPAEAASSRFRMWLLLRRQEDGWKLDALLSESEAQQMAWRIEREGQQ